MTTVPGRQRAREKTIGPVSVWLGGRFGFNTFPLLQIIEVPFHEPTWPFFSSFLVFLAIFFSLVVLDGFFLLSFLLSCALLMAFEFLKVEMIRCHTQHKNIYEHNTIIL
ncbi:MAG: hypothetical protein MUO63_05815 [Desulfobulbaceae bacterium]|nr:hypothetical protein [Desulfobulbaceae bacterium]